MMRDSGDSFGDGLRARIMKMSAGAHTAGESLGVVDLNIGVVN